MTWSPAAAAAIAKVPFFVRKRVRARVEAEAAAAGQRVVSLAAVRQTQARYLSGMQAEVRGYRVESCFGTSGCPQRTVVSDALIARVESLLAEADLLSLLKTRVKGPLRFHHELRVAFADCPNGCSQPQIRDVGIVGAVTPSPTPAACSGCAACLEACAEGALQLDDPPAAPRLDATRCLACGQCVRACPGGTLAAGRSGFRLLLGGKLGRHPRLARELGGIFDADQVVALLGDVLALYTSRNRHGQRLGELLADADYETLARRHA
jgi:dissimilatory sulfite reductase (desulfoviridin) alpha/beta subunit